MEIPTAFHLKIEEKIEVLNNQSMETRL